MMYLVQLSEKNKDVKDIIEIYRKLDCKNNRKHRVKCIYNKKRKGIISKRYHKKD